MSRAVASPGARKRRKGESGYAILLVLFLATLILLGTMAVAPNILTEGRREKEKEMIWRGKQYARGVKLFYRKNGKFPTTLDDLTKPKTGSIRFMRQAYKDPMNPKDGEWRLIYVGPTGQLLGSMKPGQTLQLGGLGGQQGLPGTSAAQVSAQSNSAGFGQTIGSPSSFGQTQAGANNQAAIPGAGGISADVNAANPANTDPAAIEAANEALLASDPVTIMGGNIIGVGSKINRRSIVVYEKAKNYKQFEFIWDPSKDAIGVGGTAGQGLGPQIGTPAGQPSGNNPYGNPGINPGTGNPGSGPGAPLNPQPGPPETTPAPPQAPQQ
jgi:hypothetical protein